MAFSFKSINFVELQKCFFCPKNDNHKNNIFNLNLISNSNSEI